MSTDILVDPTFLGCKPQASLINSKPKFWDSKSLLLSNPQVYRGLVGKLIFLTVRPHDIAYTVGLLSQFMHVPHEIH